MTSDVVALPVLTIGRGTRLRRRFLRRPLAVLGLVLVVLFLLLAVFGPMLTPDPLVQNLSSVFADPSAHHLLGTDDLGRDELARLASGARVSLVAGVLSTALAMVVGTPIGLASGYFRGWLDAVIMRFNDAVLAFPFLIFAVGFAAIFGASLRTVVIALAIGLLPAVVRVARGEAMMLREQDFIDGAVADGARPAGIVFRYLLPNSVNALIVQATVAVPTAIVGEAALSFLGLGLQPPAASWGLMLTSAQQFLVQAPQLAIYPGALIALTTLGFNLLGDGLRDALDPREGR
ncbi:MAG TPA: ABC transporter permease [Pseudonocardiaceae bacterium]|jgi:ABC-type dipeptide/oligopeptide/nickel transport system permease subunit